MALTDPTFVGQVASVSGAIVRVRLRSDMPSTLVLLAGESFRVGQVGAFFRIPLGYSNLYAICTQVGADAAPIGAGVTNGRPLDEESLQHQLSGFRWMTVVLFGEGMSNQFERGVGQYPTIGDEVHLVTNADLKVIYGWGAGRRGTVPVGQIAAASGIRAEIDIAALISRHSVVVGSTGAGKSNLVAVLLEAIAEGTFPNARVIVIDPHGEYGSALASHARVFRVHPDVKAGEKHLWVPYWALPFDELRELTLGGLQPNHEVAIRDEVLRLKTTAASTLNAPPPITALTADSPVPFSIRQLWYDLDRFERMTFPSSNPQNDSDALPLRGTGNPDLLIGSSYPPSTSYNSAPYKNNRKRNLERQLDFMRSRLKDSRFAFLFQPGDGLTPDLEGRVSRDLDALVADWIGHDSPISIFDVSGLPADIQPTVVGTMLRIVYEVLFWAQGLPIGGREQPLLVVLDEAHRFVPDGKEGPAHRTLATMAKEGRKYGAGLMLVSQRPSELDGRILSQCGSMIAMRTSNSADRAKVTANVPDDLGGLVDQLPALRTGEALFLGEIIPIPSRVRVRRARNKPEGNDPDMPDAWQRAERPDVSHYGEALLKWRSMDAAPQEDSLSEGD